MLTVAVLVVGIYAVAPISNSIVGNINISACGSTFAISAFVDVGQEYDTEVFSRTEIGAGSNASISIAKSDLSFDASKYCYPDEVPSQIIKIVIENLSNNALGVFFSTSSNTSATENNIMTYAEIKSSTNSAKTVMTAELDFYKYIAPANEDNDFDKVEMWIELQVASLTAEEQIATFAYNLNIEEYNAELNASSKFVKISDTVTEISEEQFKSNANIESVVIPTSVTTIGDNAFKSATNLKNVVIPESVTYIGDSAFASTGIKKITIPQLAETVATTAFNGGALEKARFCHATMVLFEGCEVKEVIIGSTVQYVETGYTSKEKLVIEARHESGYMKKATTTYAMQSYVTVNALLGKGTWYLNGELYRSVTRAMKDYATYTRYKRTFIRR